MSPEFAHRPSRRAGRRLAAVAAPVAAGMILLAACGSGSDEGATESTIDLSQGSTAFVVRPTETTLAPETSVAAGGVSTAAQDYTIQSGDYPLKVAQQFGVTVDELVAFNEWGSANEFPFPGTVIKIPPGATVAAATPDTTVAPAAGETTATTAAATASTAPASTIPDAGSNCAAGEHIVEAGDIPINVAKKYDVTLAALDAANANNPAYKQFIVGQTIIIPAKADC